MIAIAESAKFRTAALYATLALSLIGILDAGYLTYKFYAGGAIPCSLLKGCDVVTTSEYSKIFGMPVALLGLAFYITVFTLAVIILDRNNHGMFRWIFFLSCPALIASAYFTFLQFFVIRALCLYCLASAVTSTLIFALALAVRPGRRES